MLKNQETIGEQPPSLNAGQARVTPEELTAALAAIETRKQAEASRLAGTIPLDEAVSELHLDSTSEEIWAEVQSQRAKAAAPPPLPVLPPIPGPQSFAEAEAARREQFHRSLASQASAQTAPATLGRFGRPLGGRQRRFPRPILLFFAIGALFSTGIIPHHWLHVTHNTYSATQSLAQIPDGKEVYGDSQTLVQLSEGKSTADIKVSENQGDNSWPLVKNAGHVYLHGYTVNTSFSQNLKGKAINVYNDDNSGELDGKRTSDITLRVDKIPLQKSVSDNDYSEVTVPDFQPDSFTTLTDGH